MRTAAKITAAAAPVATIMAIDGAPSAAHHTNNVGWVGFGSGDMVYNFDHKSQSLSAGNEDWFVTIVFTDNAEIDKVKDDLTPYGFGSGGSTKRLRLNDNDGDGWAWDGDSGRDENTCPIQAHYRIYADNDDQLYSSTYGYYNVATTHQDRYHVGGCSGVEKFGWSETSSNQVRSAAINAYGQGAVTTDAINLWNSVSSHYSSNSTRYWQNDGYAHRVVVPK